jgi:hypothetical protein
MVVTKVSTLYLMPADGDRLSVGIARAAELLFSSTGAPLSLSVTHPDLRILAPLPKKTTVGIDQVRDAVRSLHFVPDNAERRVCLIPYAESLTPQAANALLKSIEEPPVNALFVLLASHASALPPTIVSRLRVERLPARLREESGPDGSETQTESGRPVAETFSDEAIDALSDGELAVLACDEGSPAVRRQGIHALLERLAAGPRRRGVEMAMAIASRGRDVVAQFVEDALCALGEALRDASGSAVSEERARHILHLCLAAQEARRGCERYAPHEAVLLSFLLEAAGGAHG